MITSYNHNQKFVTDHECRVFDDFKMPGKITYLGDTYVAYKGSRFHGAPIVAYVHPYWMNHEWKYELLFFRYGDSLPIMAVEGKGRKLYRPHTSYLKEVDKIAEQFLIKFWVTDYGYDLSHAFIENPSFTADLAAVCKEEK